MLASGCFSSGPIVPSDAGLDSSEIDAAADGAVDPRVELLAETQRIIEDESSRLEALCEGGEVPPPFTSEELECFVRVLEEEESFEASITYYEDVARWLEAVIECVNDQGCEQEPRCLEAGVPVPPRGFPRTRECLL